MIRTRRFDIVSNRDRKGLSMKVAFASTDKIHVDEHFGQAEEFYIYEIGPDSSEFTGVLQVSAEEGYTDDKIEARCAALADCAMVYVGQIGGPAAARLVQKRIHPLKSKDGEPITELVARLQEVMQGNPPPWMRKAMMKN